MADKLAKVLPTFERQKLFIYTGFSTYEQKLNFLVSALKIVYIHLHCAADRGRASILSLGSMSTNEKVYAKW